MKSKTIPLLLMGCGGVGRHLLQHIVSCRSLHANQGVYLRVVGVCDSKSLVVASAQIQLILFVAHRFTAGTLLFPGFLSVRFLLRDLAMSNEIDGLSFEQRHGKDRVRVARVWKNKEGRHFMVEWNVSISLLSDCIAAYLRDDNSDIVATDTMKNTVYVKAKECTEQISGEEFAIELAKHFTSVYKQVTAAIIKIVEIPWERVYVDGQLHEHGFKLGSEKHTTEVILKKSGALRITSGIEGLSLLKTTQSGFEGFIRDKYTALPETRERMLATEVTALWRYSYESLHAIPKKPLLFMEKYQDMKNILVETFFGPPKDGVYSPSVQSTLYQMARTALNRFPDISSIQLKMPNLHFLPVNIASKENQIVKFDDDVYLPTDEPHGSIEASLSRFWSKM